MKSILTGGGGGTGIVLAGAGIDVITCGGGILTTCTGGVCVAKPPNPRRPPEEGPGGSGGVPTGAGGVEICKKSKMSCVAKISKNLVFQILETFFRICFCLFSVKHF